MRVTAEDLRQLGVIERIVPEPLGGAHRRRAEAVAAVGAALTEELDSLSAMSPDEIRAQRRKKFLSIG
jgi:acetyl-CoA carboxylase carboxyl transferase subunit alpha